MRVEPERCQLIVMSCDFMSSTPLAERLSSGELSDLIQAYQRACRETIRCTAEPIRCQAEPIADPIERNQ
jgi:hypothetical protein